MHSQRSDNARNRLEKRFGHPALHSELFTPMVHANMTSLLSQVYHGKLKTESAKVQDMGGQKMDTTIVAGGIKIAGVQEVRRAVLSYSMRVLGAHYTGGALLERPRVRPGAVQARPRRRLGYALRRVVQPPF